ncbi:hypothetical protein [Allomesorhizobium alhagi]|uniref:Uncharacterized protein n=1 Tax=Mesorhizobium alhagi CCNWXJ12-2 TaxID=1107882 RepID=H0HNH4_9HYPH|nr:hypothetical protein [Mesorhizobium alhagi]EHK57746.1 hypothetical protein MAXJ12_08484 [Mesorhizobium alhagi CCNWXJ12-2]
MAAIKLTGFTGEQPRIIPRLMPAAAAQAALDTRLDDGGLTPMRKTALIATAASSALQTIYRHGVDWLGWETVVHAVPGPVASDRLYYTGDGVPKMRVGEDIYELAIDPPAVALTAATDGAGSGDVTTRVYVYTWVTSFGEESEPCPASNAIDWQPGDTITLSGFGATPADRAITHQRIYRSQTGQSGTYFYLIAERVAGTGDFTDDIAVDAFQEPLPSASWNAPPDTLEGLIALPNGMMAAFSGRDLYFCEPYRPHAWPQKYALAVDSDIVGLGAVGTTVIIMTEKHPYMAAGVTPETMQMQKMEQNLPCINARGIVDLGYAIAYPSHEGMVVVRADGAFAIATGNIFNREGWLALSPSTMIGAQLSGRYFAFYDTTATDGSIQTGALLLDLSGESFLIRTEASATAAFYEVSSGGLFFLKSGTDEIRQFDAPNAARRTQYWKSKQFVLPQPLNFGAIQIDATGIVTNQEEENLEDDIAAVIAANETLIAAGSVGGEIDGGLLDAYPLDGDMLTPIPQPSPNILTVGIYADQVRVASVTRANRPVRLPGGFLARTWEIDVFGDVQVEQIVMAQTIDELKQVA